MALFAFKQLRNMLAYYRELKTLAGDTGEVGVSVGDAGSIDEGEPGEEEEEDAGEELKGGEEEDYAFVKRPPVPNNGAQKKKD